MSGSKGCAWFPSDVTRLTAILAVMLLAVTASLLQAQPIGVMVDGQPLVTSAPPREVGGRILVGMRDIFERLGAGVGWEASQQMITATRGARVVTLWIGRNYARVDTSTIPLDVPPMLIGGHTYVPVRFPSEALGATVTWLSATRTVMVSTAGMPPVGGGEPPPTGMPKIDSIEAEGYTGPLKAGGKIVVRLRGTAGGQATFDIAADRLAIGMTEESSGVYRGEYLAVQNDEIVEAPLVGHLVVNSVAVDAASKGLVSLDTIAPTVRALRPQRQTQVATSSPTIQCTFDDGAGVGIDKASVTISVGGSDVTRLAQIDETSLVYYPQDLPLGAASVRVTVADLAGNQHATAWQFTVTATADAGAIGSVTHLPAGLPLGVGDTLVATMRTQKGGRSATFDIGGLRTALPMTRQDAGDSDLWRGEYTIRQGDALDGARITAHFVDRNGVKVSAEDEDTVVIAAKQRLVVLRPTNGATVPVQFELAGTALAGRRLDIEVQYRGHTKVLNTPATGLVLERRLVVNDDNTWRTSIDTGPARRNVFLRDIETFEITCTLRRATGDQLDKIVLTVKP